MNFRLMFAFAIFRTVAVVLSVEHKSECVKRKSGACRVLNITEDFDEFIPLDYSDGNKFRTISTIIEIDYVENKFSYSLNKTKKQKELDIIDNPVVEILFSERKDPEYSYRLVLGEKLNRLAYVEIVDVERDIKYNNYSPDLPSWPFAIYVKLQMNINDPEKSELAVHTKNGDGFDESEPFLLAVSTLIEVKYMSIRSRNKNGKLVGFYDCSTKYGLKCGTEMTQTITDCKEKFSPLGSGFFNTFVDMSKFNRLGKEKSNEGIINYDEIFGIYRRNNDNMHILFTDSDYEQGAYIRITIGDEITVHLRTYDKNTEEFHDKRAVRNSWNQEPSEPIFIRVVLSTEAKQITIYHHNDNDNDNPILTMKLCNYFDKKYSIKFMSVTSNRFKTVDLYYDCCSPFEPDNCHDYEKDNNQTEESTTLESSQTDATTMLNEDNSSTITESLETTTETPETTETADDDTDYLGRYNYNSEDDDDDDDDNETESSYDLGKYNYNYDYVKVIELKTLTLGEEKTNTFLNTSKFEETGSTLYVYENGTSPIYYCPDEMINVELMRITEATIVEDDDEDEDDVNPYFHRGFSSGGGLAQVISSLVG